MDTVKGQGQPPFPRDPQLSLCISYNNYYNIIIEQIMVFIESTDIYIISCDAYGLIYIMLCFSNIQLHTFPIVIYCLGI